MEDLTVINKQEGFNYGVTVVINSYCINIKKQKQTDL